MELKRSVIFLWFCLKNRPFHRNGLWHGRNDSWHLHSVKSQWPIPKIGRCRHISVEFEVQHSQCWPFLRSLLNCVCHFGVLLEEIVSKNVFTSFIADSDLFGGTQ